MIKELFLVFLTIGLARSAEEKVPGYTCRANIEGVLFRVDELKRKTTRPFKVNGSVDIEKGGIKKTVDGTIYFNLCGGVTSQEVKDCDGDETSTGFFIYKDDQEIVNCLDLSTELPKPGHSTTKWTYSTVGARGDQGLVVIGENKGTKKEVIQQSVVLNFLCKEKVQDPTEKEITFKYEKDKITISIESQYGCGKDIFGPIAVLIKLQWPICLIGIIFGLLLIPLGYKIFKLSLSILSFVISFMIVMGFFEIAWAKMNPDYKIYVILGFSLVLAFIAAYFIYSNEKTAFIVAGMFLGGVLGMILYTTLGIFKHEKDGSNFLLWLCILGGLVILGTLGYWLHDHIIVMATAFGGSYVLMKSIGSLIGNFPNEFLIAEQLKNKELESIPTMFWVYFGFIITFGIAGVAWQYKAKADREAEEFNDNDNNSFTSGNSGEGSEDESYMKFNEQ